MSEKLSDPLLNPEGQYEYKDPDVQVRLIPNVYEDSAESDSKDSGSSDSAASPEKSLENKMIINDETNTEGTVLGKSNEASLKPFPRRVLFTSVVVIFFASVISAFVLGQLIDSIIEDDALNRLVFAYLPYIGFLVSILASLVAMKNVSKHRTLRIEKYEIISIFLLCYFCLFASAFISNEIGLLKLGLSYLFRIAVILILLLIVYQTNYTLFVIGSCVFLGFLEAISIFYFEFNLQCLILMGLLIFANAIAVRLFTKFEVLKKPSFKCSIFLYLLVLLVVEINGPLLNFFSSVTVLLNHSK